ncbi:hypothetical protein Hanom_Chr09g00868061 [Helianthus anomalus]
MVQYGSDLKFATRSVLVWFKVRIGVSWTSSENISFLLFGILFYCFVFCFILILRIYSLYIITHELNLKQIHIFSRMLCL